MPVQSASVTMVLTGLDAWRPGEMGRHRKNASRPARRARHRAVLFQYDLPKIAGTITIPVCHTVPGVDRDAPAQPPTPPSRWCSQRHKHHRCSYVSRHCTSHYLHEACGVWREACIHLARRFQGTACGRCGDATVRGREAAGVPSSFSSGRSAIQPAALRHQ